MKKLLICIVALLCSTLSLSAQTVNYEKTFQVSFITPIGSNGLQSHLTTNTISLNILGGYSAANKAFEFGGLYNINSKYTRGLQFAGLFNYSGHMQSGLQFAGILNIAKKLDGVQFGLINIAGSCDKGVPIGLINIVGDGGKQEFEVAFSEALTTSASFKLGTDHFYTIFSGGVNYLEETVNYGVGIGFGTHINWKKGWGNQIEAICYSLTENGEFQKELNMLTQLKLTFSKEFSKHFKVFAGPVFNMTISSYVDPLTGELGSTLAPWTMWQNTSDETRLNGWIGFSAGVRF